MTAVGQLAYTLLEVVITAIYASLLLLAFTVASNQTRWKSLNAGLRMFMTNFMLIPQFLISSSICTLFMLFARISHPICNFGQRMAMSQFFGSSFYQVILFLFEFWPNVQMIIYDGLPPCLFSRRNRSRMAERPPFFFAFF